MVAAQSHLEMCRPLRVHAAHECQVDVIWQVSQICQNLEGVQRCVLALQVFKHYLQNDSSENGQGPVLMRSNSRKKQKLSSEAMQDGAALPEADVMEERSTSGQAPYTADSGLGHQASAGTVNYSSCLRGCCCLIVLGCMFVHDMLCDVVFLLVLTGITLCPVVLRCQIKGAQKSAKCHWKRKGCKAQK